MENRYVHFGIVLGVIAAVSAGLLGGANSFTSKVIAENTMKIVNAARKEVLPAASKFDETGKKVVQAGSKDSDVVEYIPGTDESGNVVGYVASINEAGYGGLINFVIGIDNDGKITGLNVVTHSETPGLGSKIGNKDWQDQWIGRDVSYEFNKSVDAFAGATISPKAVYTGVIKALNTYQNEVSK